jgi:hypothetical protein
VDVISCVTRSVARAIAMVAVMAVATAAQAQPGRGPQGRTQPRQPDRLEQPTDDMSPAQLHQLFDAMLVMQAQKALALSEEQYPQFLTRVQALQETRRRNQQQRLRLISDLQRLTNPRNARDADDAAVTQRLAALQELEARAAADLRRSYDGIDEVLTPVQRARFRVLEEQIERRKLELLGRARQVKRPQWR